MRFTPYAYDKFVTSPRVMRGLAVEHGSFDAIAAPNVTNCHFTPKDEICYLKQAIWIVSVYPNGRFIV